LNIIVGTYECKVDAKGRVLLPAFEKQLTLSLQSGFVLKRSVFNLVKLYPMEEWDIMMAN
jgi:MraZ protein